jgi:hypothetical protein
MLFCFLKLEAVGRQCGGWNLGSWAHRAGVIWLNYISSPHLILISLCFLSFTSRLFCTQTPRCSTFWRSECWTETWGCCIYHFLSTRNTFLSIHHWAPPPTLFTSVWKSLPLPIVPGSTKAPCAHLYHST